jgi:Zn-finger nucleic acid-binding protein
MSPRERALRVDRISTDRRNLPMQCPRCPDQVLDERVREGLTIDTCPGCRGVWLDRGELERLLARAREEEAAVMATRGPRRDHDDDDDDDDDRRERRYAAGPYEADRDRPAPHGQYKKKRWFDSLGDIFD